MTLPQGVITQETIYCLIREEQELQQARTMAEQIDSLIRDSLDTPAQAGEIITEESLRRLVRERLRNVS